MQSVYFAATEIETPINQIPLIEEFVTACFPQAEDSPQHASDEELTKNS